MKPIVWTQNLCKTYGMDENKVEALKDANISIIRGEAVAVVGSSGSGKSTLLHLLGGLDRPTSGSVHVDDVDIFGQGDALLAQYRRRKIGFVFQSYNLMPQLTVWENIVLPLGLDGRKPDRDHIMSLMATLGIDDKQYRYPNQLSGGQQQRVAIARALSTQPALLLCDEPTGNLDSKTGAEVLNLLRLSVDKYKQTLMIITHDDKAAQQCDRLLRIEDGQIREG